MRVLRHALSGIAAALLAALPAAAQPSGPAIPLRVTGHFSQNHKHIEIERAFYTGLAAETGINLQVTFNPMDQVGVQAADALRHLRSGAFDVMSVVMGNVARDEPFLDGLDLIGVSPTVDELKLAVDAGRPIVERRLQERFQTRAMALWPFGPQYFFCKPTVQGLADLRGLKVRSYTPSMTALLTSLGASPVSLQFSEVYPALQRGVVDCGITSATSAYSGNWGEVITHVLPLSLAGGIQGHFMSGQAWRRFSPEQQAALTKAFARLEQQLWDLARTSDAEALACLGGKPECATRRFSSTIATVPQADATRLREAVTTAVLPTFRESCNRVWAECATMWNESIGKARGFAIP
jgi:TRAP-type C4-dicarboxylate transport system substrate-binding protein